MKRAAILAVLLLGLVAAADADPVVRGVLVAAVTIVGAVTALVLIGARGMR